MTTNYSELQKKEADYDTLLGSGIKDKFETLQKEHFTLNIETSFNEVKPSFPKEANEFEVASKWNDFKKDVLTKYELRTVEGEVLAISKENEHKQVKLKDLVKDDAVIGDLIKGRQQDGINATQTDAITVEGIPFKIDVNMPAKERHAFIQSELMKKYPVMSNEYAKAFKEINDSVLKQRNAL